MVHEGGATMTWLDNVTPATRADMDTVYLERYGREIASDPDVREKVELDT